MTGNWFSTLPLQGQVAVITGGGQGIGRAIAIALASAGAKVVVASRNKEKLLGVCEEINANGGESLAVRTDVSCQEDIDNLVAASCEAFERIDILVNNAGISIPRISALDVSRQDWEKVLGIDLTAVFFASQAAARIMARNGGGKIVNIASIVGRNPLPGIVPYCTAKGAVMALTKALAIDLAAWY